MADPGPGRLTRFKSFYWNALSGLKGGDRQEIVNNVHRIMISGWDVNSVCMTKIVGN
jgi:hypothetical protein